MSVSGGGRAGVGGVSGGVEDRVDAFALSWFLSRVVASVPHAGPGSGGFFLGGVLWKTVLYGMAYVAGLASPIRRRPGLGARLVNSSSVSRAVLFFAVLILLWRFEGGNGRPGLCWWLLGCWCFRW